MSTHYDRRLTITAAVRRIGDARRQRLLNHLERKAKVRRVEVRIDALTRFVNLMSTASSNRGLWLERTKKNAFYFRKASRLLANELERTANYSDVLLLFEALYSPAIDTRVSVPYVIYEDTTRAIAQSAWPNWVVDTSRTREYLELEAACYHNAAAIITSNERTRQSLINDYGVLPHKVNNVWQGCDLEPSAATGVTRIDDLLVFVGYDFHRKGGDVLLEAFRVVRKTVPHAKLLIVGPDIKIREAGVQVIGRVHDAALLSELYGRAAAFVLPAIFDPMPHAAMEAMAADTPVIVSSACGTAELIDNGRNGFVVPPGNSAALAQILSDVLGDPRAAQEVGVAGGMTIRTMYTWEQVSERILTILNDVARQGCSECSSS